MGAAVEARAAGEQTVAVGNLTDILIGAAGGDDGPCAAVFPQINVMLGVECHNPLAGGAGGGLNADTVLEGNTDKTVRIGLPQVGLGEERKL